MYVSMYVFVLFVFKTNMKDVSSVMLTAKDSIASYPDQIAGDLKSWLKYLETLPVVKNA